MSTPKKEGNIILEFEIEKGEIVDVIPHEGTSIKYSAKTIGDLPKEFLSTLKNSASILIAQNSPACVVIKTPGGYIVYCSG